MALLALLLLALIFVISSLPLYFAAKFLGGKTTIIKVILVNLLVAVITYIIDYLFETWSGLIAFVLMIWIYKDLFRIGWIKAVLVWLLQFVMALLLVLILTLAGISLVLL